MISTLPFLLSERRERKRWFLVFALMLIALLLTTKRAHLVFGVVSIACGYALLNSKLKLKTISRLMVIALISMVALYAISLYAPDLVAVFDRIMVASDDETFGGRAMFYQLCLEMWESSPLIGHGMGAYTETFNHTALGFQYIFNGYTQMKAHNVYLQVLAEGGIFGAFLFLSALFGSIAFAARKLVHANASHSDLHIERCLLAGSIAIQVFFLLYCITGNPLYSPQAYIPYIMCCGAGFCIARSFSSTLSAKATRR